MINSIIGEIEGILLKLARRRFPVAVHADTVAKALGDRNWRQYRPLVAEAGRLLERRGLVTSDDGRTLYRLSASNS